MKLPISVVINTFQAERYLDLVLRSVVDHVEEIVVCDMYSDDRTVEIAEEFGAKVVFHERVGYVEPARKFAVDQSNQPWVLILDADELVEPRLVPFVRELIDLDQSDYAWVPSSNFMFGEIVRHSGFGPDQDKHVRIFRRGSVQLGDMIHAGITPIDGAREFTFTSINHGSFIHFNYLSVEEFVGKMNRYTTIEAQRSPRAPKARVRIIRRMASEFRHRFFSRKGRLDGWRGFSLALLMVFYDVLTELKMMEREENIHLGEMYDHYRHIGEELLSLQPQSEE